MNYDLTPNNEISNFFTLPETQFPNIIDIEVGNNFSMLGNLTSAYLTEHYVFDIDPTRSAYAFLDNRFAIVPINRFIHNVFTTFAVPYDVRTNSGVIIDAFERIHFNNNPLVTGNILVRYTFSDLDSFETAANHPTVSIVRVSGPLTNRIYEVVSTVPFNTRGLAHHTETHLSGNILINPNDDIYLLLSRDNDDGRLHSLGLFPRLNPRAVSLEVLTVY
ncbi:MAG: hypothetical protein Hyperionvirus6_75 [Hyperionvirus sp.]|uniref:Uncharacterized protein n=1 Tax=Hyperionvirus sp. TaxID=2487770 RepID=A0A3G5AA81_9VIRU|nr:MAG: hypothetical protein Hyperionvirus6_75 [Hyperionvirus sp.]